MPLNTFLIQFQHQQKPGIVIPMGPQLMSPSQSSSGQTVQSTHTQQPGPPPGHSSMGVQASPIPHSVNSNIQVKTLTKPTIQIKQEGGEIL